MFILFNDVGGGEAVIKLNLLAVILILLTNIAYAQSPSCSLMQSALYSKSTIKIQMVLGYKDARPARYVGDRHERLAYIEKLTENCRGTNEACGFTRSESDLDLFTKQIMMRGQEKTIQLFIVNSSVGTDDQENRSDPFQVWKSRHAQDSFLNGIEESDVVFYNGHSRFGGGPDFRPPMLSDNGAVDPSFYQTRRAGLGKLLDALEDSQRPKQPLFSQPLKILGLFSCSSSQHFTSEIRKVSHTGVIASHVLMYYSDAMTQSLESLDDVLSQRCPKGITF